MPTDTYHPGAYRGARGEPRLDPGALPRLLVRPRRALEALWHHTGAIHGIVVAAVLIVATMLVQAILRWVYSGEILGLLGRFSPLQGVLMGLLAFLLMVALTFLLVRAFGDARRPDAGMTCGLMGYAMFPVVVIGIILSVATAYYGDDLEAFRERTGSLAEEWTGWTQYWVVYYVLLVAMVLWGVRVQAIAASVANDSAPGRTLGLVLVAWLASALVWVLALEMYLWATRGEWAELPWLPL